MDNTQTQPPIHPLFICHGNLCRSQMAEAFYNYFTNTTNATSAATYEDSPLWNKQPDPTTIKAMQEKNIDIANQPIKALTTQMAEAADKIIVMCDPRECPPYILNSPKTIYWNVPDPWGQPLPYHQKVRDQIERLVHQLIQP